MVSRVAVTGAEGFIGWHLRCLLLTKQDVEVVCVSRSDFSSYESLADKLIDVDVVVHLAGVNRGTDLEVALNPELAAMVTKACDHNNAKPYIVFSSSIHIDKRTSYGRSKRSSAEIFRNWASSQGADFLNLILPHIYGEYARPYYNSVVATFGHQLARNEQVTVVNNDILDLVHVQDLAEIVYSYIRQPINGEKRLSGCLLSVRDLLERMEEMSRKYDKGSLPKMSEKLDIRLFNTLRSYYYPQRYPIPIYKNTDERGALVETVKAESGGQLFYSTTGPGVERGNHFHRYKMERFCVVKGKAIIRIRKLFHSSVDEFHVTGDNPSFIDIPTLHTHSIINTGRDELLTLFWSNEIFDESRPDTYREPVV